MQLSAMSSIAQWFLAQGTALQHKLLTGVGNSTKHRKLASDLSFDLLSEAGVLQRILSYVGPGHWLCMSLVSRAWRDSYLQVPEQHFIEYDAFDQDYNVDFTCTSRMTLQSGDGICVCAETGLRLRALAR
jgi:F-box domain